MALRTQRKERENEARRQEILAEAECLFSKNGFFKTSMADIAAASQFAMGTLYRFFKSKEQIYVSILEGKLEELARLLEEAIAQANSASDKVKAFIQVTFEYADQNRDIFCIYVSGWSGVEWTIKYEWAMKSVMSERVCQLYEAQVDMVADLIRQGIRRKEFRKIDPKDGAFALHGMLHATTYAWILQEDSPGTLLEKQEIISSLFVDGLKRGTDTRVTRRIG